MTPEQAVRVRLVDPVHSPWPLPEFLAGPIAVAACEEFRRSAEYRGLEALRATAAAADAELARVQVQLAAMLDDEEVSV